VSGFVVHFVRRFYRPRRLIVLALIGLLFCGAALAQNAPPVPVASDVKGIQDNSFLMEEAYNQEYGVVQHINSFFRSWTTHQWLYTFTQEWPVDPAPRHQLSYTIPVARLAPGNSGVGDVALNYRYQLIGNGGTRVAFSPRFTFLLPTGEYKVGRGTGGAGVQGSLPLSVVMNKYFVTHWNVGTTIVPSARNAVGDRAATFGYNLGQSTIWLVHPRFNVMMETVFASSQTVASRGRTQTSHELLLSPGIRWAYNFSNGLQIVPGIAVPIGVGPDAGEKNIFFYLSFEHPYRKLKDTKP
jgi:hypothetical protein